MDKLKGEFLLAEEKVRALRKELRRDENIPRRIKNKIELVFKMAIRYINWTQRFWRFRGKYEECYPELARGICETFYADDTELAACFRVKPAVIKRWQRLYPDFKNNIHAGRSCFTRQGGSEVCRQRWFHLRYTKIARNIYEVFDPTKKQLKHCFNIKSEANTWKELKLWMDSNCYESVYTHFRDIKKQIFDETIERICNEFNLDSKQFAQCFGVSEKYAEEFLAERKLKQEDEKRQMEGFERSISGSPEAEVDNDAGRREETEKHE